MSWRRSPTKLDKPTKAVFGCLGCSGLAAVVAVLVAMAASHDSQRDQAQQQIQDEACRYTAHWRSCAFLAKLDSVPLTVEGYPACLTKEGLVALEASAQLRDLAVYQRAAADNGCFFPAAGTRLTVLDDGFSIVRLRLYTPDGTSSGDLWAPREIVRPPIRK